MKQTVFKRLTTVVAVTAVICAATAPLQAEERAVTLQEIMAIAKENNGDLKALREEVGIGEAVKIKAGLFPNPVLDLEGTTGALTGSSSENRVSFGVSQEFLTGGKREKRLAVAESELMRFGSRIKDAERLLLLDVKTGFYDLLLVESRLELAHKSQELNNQLLQITKERLVAGDIAELDVNLARVETARSEGRKIEAERELVPSRQRLLSLMGAPTLTDLKIAGSPESKPFAANPAELKALALNNRPDLQVLAAEKSKGEAELSLARAERLPNVTAGIAVSRESTALPVGGGEDRDTDYLIGLKLSVPIPFLDRNQAALKEAQTRKSSAEIRQAFVRQSIEREVEAAHARFVTAEKSQNIYAREIIPQLTENLKLVQEAYRLGEVGILAVIEEQKKFIEVNDGYLTALYNWNIAAAKLEAAVGIELKKDDGGNK
ncbi:MAG: cobalt-zinc-cadmium resistance protein [Geobacteraceae bacterium]|nr:MAG: cobalt-zinc-cadmium resistance protein [Geobacteraceae bacterium]